jgi:hypothetical protein
MAQGDKPVKEFRAGSVRASIWQDEVAGKDEEAFSVFSVRVEKRFKDAMGVWQSTNRFKRRELADLELAVFEAREFTSLSERDPEKQTDGEVSAVGWCRLCLFPPPTCRRVLLLDLAVDLGMTPQGQDVPQAALSADADSARPHKRSCTRAVGPSSSRGTPGSILP